MFISVASITVPAPDLFNTTDIISSANSLAELRSCSRIQPEADTEARCGVETLHPYRNQKTNDWYSLKTALQQAVTQSLKMPHALKSYGLNLHLG